MRILVIAAKEAEIKPTVEFRAAHYPNDTQIQFAYTDIGLTAAAFSITRLALTQAPDLIIQAGIAGSFETGYEPGEVVLDTVSPPVKTIWLVVILLDVPFVMV
jgi:futalosine hydrolase